MRGKVALEFEAHARPKYAPKAALVSFVPPAMHALSARVPKCILKCEAVSRKIVFRSKQQMANFRLEQRIFVHGNCIESE